MFVLGSLECKKGYREAQFPVDFHKKHLISIKSSHFLVEEEETKFRRAFKSVGRKVLAYLIYLIIT